MFTFDDVIMQYNSFHRKWYTVLHLTWLEKQRNKRGNQVTSVYKSNITHLVDKPLTWHYICFSSPYFIHAQEMKIYACTYNLYHYMNMYIYTCMDASRYLYMLRPATSSHKTRIKTLRYFTDFLRLQGTTGPGSWQSPSWRVQEHGGTFYMVNFWNNCEYFWW